MGDGVPAGRELPDQPKSLSQLAAQVLAGAGAADWSVRRLGRWCVASPADHVTRRQGWKLHVSGTPASAADLLRRALPVLVSHRCSTKFAADLAWAHWLNSPRCPRGNASKFLTAYPDDDEHFRQLAGALDAATQGLVGPEILSDRRYRPGSVVYYRFGGFSGDVVLDDDGHYRFVLVDPDGRLVEDRRDAWYEPPSWAVPPLPDPPATGPPAGVSAPVVLGGRFTIRTALRHSSRGGVFLGTDQADGALVVVKQARAHMELDRYGADCRDRLRGEAGHLERLASEGLAPRVRAVVREADDLFLIRDAVDGRTVRQWVAGHLPGGVPVEAGLAMARALVRLVDAVHAAGLVLVDVSPGNIMVDAAGELRLIDLDHAVASGEDIDAVGTPGYTPPEHLGGGVPARPAADLFGLGGLLFLLATGTDPVLGTENPPGRPSRARLRAWLGAAGADVPLAGLFAGAIVGLTQDRPSARWRPARVLRFLDRAGAGTAPPIRRPSRAALRRTVDELVADGVTELLARMTPDADRLWPAGPSGESTDRCAVHHGAAGVLAVLVRTAPWTADPDGVRAAVAVAGRWIDKRLPDEPRLLPGLHFGRAGTAWALQMAAALLDDRRLHAVALNLALRLPVAWGNPDVASGAAGAGMALLHLWRATGDPRLRARIGTCADGLVAAAHDRDGAVAWPISATVNSTLRGATFYGYAHGTAGIGAFLLAAGVALDRPEYGELARRAADTLAAAARYADGAAYWPAGPDGGGAGGDVPTNTSWCRGSAGVGTFLLSIGQVTGEPRYLEPARAAGVAVHRSRLRATTATCHGLAGGGHFLLDLADALDDAAHRDQAWDLAGMLAIRSVRQGGRLLVPDETGQDITVDYGIGLAGAVDFLARLRHGGAPPWAVGRDPPRCRGVSAT